MSFWPAIYSGPKTENCCFPNFPTITPWRYRAAKSSTGSSPGCWIVATAGRWKTPPDRLRRIAPPSEVKPVNVLKNFNLLVKFLLELAMLAAFAYWGLSLDTQLYFQIAAGVAA